MTNKQITIGTRPSKLAMWQAEHVKELIEKKHAVEVQIKKITTKGDKILDRSLVAIGGKGLFLKEIEEELLAGTIDMAVHSMKDVPHDMPASLVIAAMLKREDPSDAFVSVKYKSLNELPKGAIVGTTSLRRMVQIKQVRTDLNFKDLRGNVDTRLQKLQAGEYDAVILASAGLIRLGLENHITQKLDIVPAVGQGAIGIECHKDNQEIVDIVSSLNHEETFKLVNHERKYAKKVGATCQTPIGAIASWDDETGECQLRTFNDNEN